MGGNVLRAVGAYDVMRNAESVLEHGAHHKTAVRIFNDLTEVFWKFHPQAAFSWQVAFGDIKRKIYISLGSDKLKFY